MSLIDPQTRVTEFHRLLGHPIGDSSNPQPSRNVLRASLIIEEAIETALALLTLEYNQPGSIDRDGAPLGVAFNQLSQSVYLSLQATKESMITRFVSAARYGGPITQDELLALVIDGMCDILYVTYGCAVEIGVDLAPFFDEVHAANIEKFSGPKSELGKSLKPEGWQPPRIEAMLARLRDPSLPALPLRAAQQMRFGHCSTCGMEYQWIGDEIPTHCDQPITPYRWGGLTA